MYVVIEGIDGTGKDTQADLLARKMDAAKVAEPSNLPTGKLLRQMLADGTYPAAHAPLFVADRMALMSETVLPALDAGKIVISVRSWMSTLVYQQDQWPLEWLISLHQQLPCKPDHIFLLDLPVGAAMDRLAKRMRATEVYETVDALNRARARYLGLTEHPGVKNLLADGGQIHVVNGEGNPDDIHEEILKAMGL